MAVEEGRSGPEGVRASNLEQVLGCLSRLEPATFATREDLVRETGLAHATVARAIELLRARPEMVEFSTSPSSPRGAESLSLKKDVPGFVVGLEFSHHKVAAAIGDIRCSIQCDDWLIDDNLGFDVDANPDEAIARGALLIKQLIYGRDPNDLIGIGIGVAAPILEADGALPRVLGLGGPGSLTPPNWVNRFPGQELRALLPRDWNNVEIEVDNDANLAALDEYRWSQRYWEGALQDMLFVKWATGVGGGLVLGGRIYRGHSGFGGEIGHSPIPGLDPLDEPRDEGGNPIICRRCGKHDCLENVISYERIRRDLGRNVSRHEIDESDAGQERLVRYSPYIGRSIAPLVNALNPQLVVIGGPTEAVRQKVLNGVREGLNEVTVPAIRADVQVKLAEQRWEDLGDSGSRYTVVSGAMHRVLDLHAPAYLRRLVEQRSATPAR